MTSVVEQCSIALETRVDIKMQQQARNMTVDYLTFTLAPFHGKLADEQPEQATLTDTISSFSWLTELNHK